jgi:hypothetical protein
MQLERAACGAVFFVLLLMLAGCGGGSMADVSGTVKIDGKPLEDGAIRFTPEDGKTQTAGGFIKGGQYSVKVPVSVMKVSISAPKVVGHKKLYDTPDSETRPITAEALPARYNEQTELKLDVKSGTNQKDFELKSK